MGISILLLGSGDDSRWVVEVLFELSSLSTSSHSIGLIEGAVFVLIANKILGTDFQNPEEYQMLYQFCLTFSGTAFKRQRA
jgi:hypothetical protein